MSTNRRKTNPDDFTDSVGARELDANRLRKSLEYDAYGSETEFDVIVLSKPIPLNGNDASLLFGSGANPGPATGQPGMVVGSIAFKGRIVGGPYLSPHLSLPDPCNLPEATDQAAAAKVIAMHTTFISTQGSIQQGAHPKVGDRVRVSLLPGEYKFNLQYAYFNKITNSSEGAAVASAMSADCTTLAGLFNGFDPSTDLGSMIISMEPPDGAGGGDHRHDGPQIYSSAVYYGNAPGGTLETPRKPGAPIPIPASRGTVIMPTPPTNPIIGPKVPSQFPAKGTLTSQFSYHRRFSNGAQGPHPGLDIGARVGTPVYSALNDGRVYYIKKDCVAGDKKCGGGFGNQVVLEHHIGGKIIYTAYNHLSKVSISRRATNINMATKIGEVGDTGYSTGPHLHWEVYEGKKTSRFTVSGKRGDPLDPSRSSHRDPIQALLLTGDVPKSGKLKVAPREDRDVLAVGLTSPSGRGRGI